MNREIIYHKGIAIHWQGDHYLVVMPGITSDGLYDVAYCSTLAKARRYIDGEISAPSLKRVIKGVSA